MAQPNSVSSGSAQFSTTASRRKQLPVSSEDELGRIIEQTSSLSLDDRRPSSHRDGLWESYINPAILTSIAAFVRLYKISLHDKVVWDEAHFGKFGSHYLQHEFYFDVHPPLGKLLVALSGYLAGYDGSFSFESGLEFPSRESIMFMRKFNCAFGILCTPLAYFTARELGMSQLTVWFISLSVALEMLSLTLSRFILLDSMLLFFTVSTFFGLIKIHSLRNGNKLITMRGFGWLMYTGVSIGCVCSVKWVGLFVTVLVGLYIIYDLLIRYYQTTVESESSVLKLSWPKYLQHWLSRIISLIVIPFVIYVVSFKIHFAVLNRSGPGDGSISTLLQATLEGNTIRYGPRSAAYGSLVTLRSQGLSPNLLHSHNHRYPEGSQQQQVTTYGYKDNNNEFLIEFDLQTSLTEKKFATLEDEEKQSDFVSDFETLVKDGDTIRLRHAVTGCFLHSHSIPAHISTGHYEVSCYGGVDIPDDKDDWVVEIEAQYESPSPAFADEDPELLHPISSNFRLRHKVLGCYLATTGYAYPAWGFQQGEVICKNTFLAQDKSSWWNIEDHVNDKLEMPKDQYVAPKPRFWKEFILINYGMMASNNALVPDPDHYDKLESQWWEWPILRKGLRMNAWSLSGYRYLLMGNIFVTYFTTVCIPLVCLLIGFIFIQGQRQAINLNVTGPEWNFLLSAGILPLLGWVLHYWPFIAMGRVTYLHHYVPALYFAIFVAGFFMEYLVARRANKYLKYVIYLVTYVGIIGSFLYYKDFCWGMTGPLEQYKHLSLLRTWQVY
ncbi:Dolichyl-phosphate-mannose-protein mannosyltransferase family protein [Clavispora lusitaniae]|uniref:Dolichyl-phosphate-mannose--protein mannosyltransferase n=1 Tax=Clavispora lusitaniae (strain ATCC 42720) TaxID=306902 RepID=C4XZD4_CLAL4|nr:uncharacterized protein CLUG_01316 [Clavispora lusitaniae ATCC 42720]EEQ37193.1 hypothetical protein CLUG_01316 [Clavispora lusitaniae ATCC 42720]KAF5212406.1 hypothetical protein E0198_001971 [Clavispora lusitaniae]KAF7583824.1 Dolichyl-phosphate-mannose-protein mannosyltransferase family protein [Clavispora lusitaniae]